MNFDKSKAKNNASSDNKGAGGFMGFFKRHKTKVNNKPTVSNTLVQFAEEDSKRIAVLIKSWLEADDKARSKAITESKPRR
ncbi:hypothetical protein [Planctobacterium marinum]|uniref:Uncharacterized protein n=1 Tax=Planctobacterium marinum TaxID=1631968 RepID=A0AA48HQ78_9ALTE|nr:hypothetical protein MACH26_15050 [Planctobacterium marinum]